MRTLSHRPLSWEMNEPFVISRGSQTHADSVLVEIADESGRVGRGEACGIPYKGETVETMAVQIEAARAAIEDGASRQDLLTLLPIGGARNAIDLALWDLEAKISGIPAWKTAGLSAVRPMVTAQTIGILPIEAFRAKARELAHFPLLKIKLGGGPDDLDILAAIHAEAPGARLIVDPNQSWSVEMVKEYAPHLGALGVALLEQPVPVDADAGLADYRGPIPVCADEALNDRRDLSKILGKYSHVNIKLDKTGGLTEALALAAEAQALGFKLMVGCMAGSSLAMAPGAIIGLMSEFVDLDGPLLQKEDVPHAITYKDGVMDFPTSALWG